MSGSRKQSVIWSPTAFEDLVRLRNFIAPHNPDAARRAAESLKKAAKLLAEHPGLGKRLEGRTDRELMVPFGQRGYALRYRLDGAPFVSLVPFVVVLDATVSFYIHISRLAQQT